MKLYIIYDQKDPEITFLCHIETCTSEQNDV